MSCWCDEVKDYTCWECLEEIQNENMPVVERCFKIALEKSIDNFSLYEKIMKDYVCTCLNTQN